MWSGAFSWLSRFQGEYVSNLWGRPTQAICRFGYNEQTKARGITHGKREDAWRNEWRSRC
jgi:hypothetical protein